MELSSDLGGESNSDLLAPIGGLQLEAEEDLPWLHGPISRQEADRLLQNAASQRTSEV